MGILLSIVVVLAMLVCVLLIPLGLPGLWLIVMITLGLVLLGSLTWTFGLIVAAVALIAEIAEFGVLKRFGEAQGASRKAFWGAVLGGFVGLFVGLPVLVKTLVSPGIIQRSWCFKQTLLHKFTNHIPPKRCHINDIVRVHLGMKHGKTIVVLACDHQLFDM